MRFAAPGFMLVVFFGASSFAVNDDEPITLMGTIVKWQYPESKINGAEMSDAATMDASGKRTVPSVMLKATMTTEDSVDDVLKFYRALLKRDPNADDKLGDKTEAGRSVVISDESDGRPFAFHTITVNTSTTSTTLIITRGADENETRITWKHYSRYIVDGSKADLPFAEVTLENGLEVKLWAKPNFNRSVMSDISTGQMITTSPKTGQSLFAGVQSADFFREIDVNFKGPTDSVSVAYSKDRKFVAIYSPNNLDILLLADIDNHKFASPMTIWSADYDAIENEPGPRPRCDRRPGPVRTHWQAILQQIRTANPRINIGWNCL